MSETVNPRVTIQTSKGEMTAELWADRAPQTVANFLQYADEHFYDGTLFHRVIPGFMIQGGGMGQDMVQQPTRPPIRNEAAAELANRRGALAMARTSDPHSATAQFFINLKDNDFLNHTAPTPDGYGYCAFGELTDGLAVLDAIAAVATTTRGRHENVPVEPVVLQSIRRA